MQAPRPSGAFVSVGVKNWVEVAQSASRRYQENWHFAPKKRLGVLEIIDAYIDYGRTFSNWTRSIFRNKVGLTAI